MTGRRHARQAVPARAVRRGFPGDPHHRSARRPAPTAGRRAVRRPAQGRRRLGGAGGGGPEALARVQLDGELLVQPRIDFVHEVSFYVLDGEIRRDVRPAPRPAGRSSRDYTHCRRLAFAQRFVNWIDLEVGIQRVDACRHPDGAAVVEVEDLNPYLSLDLVPDDVRQAFVADLTVTLERLVSRGVRDSAAGLQRRPGRRPAGFRPRWARRRPRSAARRRSRPPSPPVGGHPDVSGRPGPQAMTVPRGLPSNHGRDPASPPRPLPWWPRGGCPAPLGSVTDLGRSLRGGRSGSGPSRFRLDRGWVICQAPDHAGLQIVVGLILVAGFGRVLARTRLREHHPGRDRDLARRPPGAQRTVARAVRARGP